MNNDEILEALKYIDPSGLSYQEWCNVGMAIKDAGLGWEVFDDWSSRDAQRYHPGECERKFDSFNEHGITKSTLFQMAYEGGYEASRRNEPIITYELDDWIVDDTPDAFIDKTWVEREDLHAPPLDEWDQVDDLKRYIKALFRDTEYVSFVPQAWQDKDGKWKPGGTGVYSMTAGQILHDIEKSKGDITRVIGDYQEEAGVWVRFNPLDGKGVKNSNVTAFRYALIESDSMDLSMQLAMIKKLELPAAAVVYSGGKSIHAIVHIDAPDIEEYKKRVEFLYKICKKNGLDLDQQNKNPSRLSRLPGVMRGDRQQWLVATNIGKADWNEWEEYIDQISDDLPDPETLQDVWNDMPALAPELIGGVLRFGHKMMIAGPSKAGKSFFQIELCVAIAEGRHWMNFPCAKGKVLYLNLELDRASCLHRFKDVYEQMGIKNPDLNNIVIWNLRGKSLSLDKLAPKLVRRMKKENFTAVVIDPIYKVITGDENSAEQMSKFCNQFDYIASELGCAVIYCHHHSKGSQGSKKSMDRASGSGVFARDPDAMIDMIELPLTDLVKKRHQDEVIAETFALEIQKRNPKYFMTIPEEDFRSSKEMGGHAYKCLRAFMDDNQIDAIRDAAIEVADSHTAWRLDFTLREFARPDDVNIWFEYPIHHVDDRGLLKDLEPEGDMAPWERAKNARKDPEQKKNKRQSDLEIAYANIEAGLEDGEYVTVDDLAAELKKSDKTVKTYIKESEGRFKFERIEGTKQFKVVLNDD